MKWSKIEQAKEKQTTRTTRIDLTDAEVADFIAFRKHKHDLESLVPSWKQVIDFAEGLKSGSFTLTIQNGKPVRINNPMQTVVIGIKLWKLFDKKMISCILKIVK